VEQFSPHVAINISKTPKSNDIGIEQHQMHQAIENNPTTGETYKKVDVHLP
jgi:hypothetical protein